MDKMTVEKAVTQIHYHINTNAKLYKAEQLVALVFDPEHADKIAAAVNRDAAVRELVESHPEIHKVYAWKKIVELHKPKPCTVGELKPEQKCTFNENTFVRTVDNGWIRDILKATARFSAPADWTVLFNLNLNRIDVVPSDTPCEPVDDN